MHSERNKQAILITGGSRGLGLETAIALAEAGFVVWPGVRNSEAAARVEAAARARNVQLYPIPLDVTDRGAIDRAFNAIAAHGVSLYGVVNNAGVAGSAYFEEFPEKIISDIFQVNVFGAMEVTRRALPLLRDTRRGRIIFISSICGRIGSMSVAPYISSKFAVEGFGEALSLELKPFGIEVVIIEPGIVRTEIWEQEHRILPPARNPQSPYYNLFWNAEKLAERLLKTSQLTPRDVAACVVRAVTIKHPRLRYIVGRRAGLIVALRRYLPGELFEKLYFGEILRRVTRNGELPG